MNEVTAQSSVGTWTPDGEVAPPLSEDALIAEAHFILVAVRRGTFETVPVPEELKRHLAPYTQPPSE